MASGSRSPLGLVDTNVLIQLVRLDPNDLPDEIVVSAVSLAEISAGPYHTTDAAERARRTSVLQHVEATFEPLPFDAAAARAFGQVSAAVLAVGRKTRSRLADLMIASVAVSNGLPLYTSNPDDFRGLDVVMTVVPVGHR